ncbi:MAG: acetate uptake transporter [Candidatus Thermoplasmatota archaeon]
MTDAPREVRIVAADPAAFGLLGLAIATLVASSVKLELAQGTLFIVPWALFFGALAQFVTSIIEYRRNNAFGATAFGAYGMFWFALGLTWLWAFEKNIDIAAYERCLGFGFLGFLIFNTYMLYGAASINKALFMVFFFFELLFLGLLFQIFMGASGIYAGLAELGVSISSFYASAALVLKATAGSEVLPLGKPLLELKPLFGA